MRKTGSEKARTDNVINVRSIQVPARHADSTPSGTARTTAKSMVLTVKASVGSIRAAMRLSTG